MKTPGGCRIPDGKNDQGIQNSVDSLKKAEFDDHMVKENTEDKCRCNVDNHQIFVVGQEIKIQYKKYGPSKRREEMNV